MASVTRAIPVGLHCSNHRRHRQNHSLPPKRLLPPVRPPALLWRGFPAFATPKSAPPHASESGTVNLTVEEEEEGGPDAEMEALPDEFYDEEWQARQREKTREWHAYREKEEEAERRKEEEYREIAMRLERFPKAEVHKAKKLVSSFILAGEEIEERIGEAAETGELTEVVLMVIWNRLDLARKDDCMTPSEFVPPKRRMLGGSYGPTPYGLGYGSGYASSYSPMDKSSSYGGYGRGEYGGGRYGGGIYDSTATGSTTTGPESSTGYTSSRYPQLDFLAEVSESEYRTIVMDYQTMYSSMT